jgi:hypothetical protein
MRNSRDSWKMKNRDKRKIINQLNRQISASRAKVELKEAEIRKLESLREVSKNSAMPIPPDLAEIIKRIEELNRRQREEIQQLEEENEKQQREIERLQEELESKKACIPFMQTSQSTQVLCVYLLIRCGVSFRSVPRILQALVDFGILREFWIPKFTSVINWTLRLGGNLLRQVGVIDDPWIAIMDTSIDIGIRKAVVILRVRLAALGERGSAIALQDCQVIFLKVVESCTGEVISKCLESAFNVAGRPVAILKDGGKDLEKGTSMYREENHCKNALWIIADLGHVIANALKSEFAKTVGFKRLLALVYGGAKRLRQTNAAIFLPPKLRTKGRFQGISRLAEWAIWILDLMAVQGQVQESSLLAALRKGFPKLPRLRAFIEKFAITCKVMNELQDLLKNKGLIQETYRQSLLILSQLPEHSHTRQTAQKWLDRTLGIQCRLAISQTPLLVSSDAIESLMGRLKSILGRSPTGELNRMTLILPALCGQVTPESIATALSQTAHMDLLKMEDDVIPKTLSQQKNNTLHLLRTKQEVPETSQLRQAG